jgi:transposase, IS5 family
MHQTKKGNQWYFGMKAHLGADAGTGYDHTVTATAANVHDLEEAPSLVRADDETVYADYGYQGQLSAPRSPSTSTCRRSSGASLHVKAR